MKARLLKMDLGGQGVRDGLEGTKSLRKLEEGVSGVIASARRVSRVDATGRWRSYRDHFAITGEKER